MKATATAHAIAIIVSSRGVETRTGDIVHELGFDPLFLSGASDLGRTEKDVGLCLIDLRSGSDALRCVRLLRSKYPAAVLLGIADSERPAASGDGIRAGLFDVLPRPVKRRDVETLITNAAEQQRLGREGHHGPSPHALRLIGASPAMRLALDLAEKAASGRAGVLVCGEAGSGRELIARAIHAHGPRRDAPFVVVDASSGSSEELELDLFGNVSRRAANAPERRRIERVERDSRIVDAASGTLFIEHVAEMPARIQARLARVLREGEVACSERRSVRFEGRPMASADMSIELALEDGRLRTDLYDRLAAVRIDVPPLRMRRDDIPLLASQFVKELCEANARPLKTLTRPALTLLSALPWRGNVPELRQLLERLLAAVPNGLIRLEDVLAHTTLEGSIAPSGAAATLRQARARFERDYVGAVLQHHHGRIAEAARALGIQRTNLYRKMRRLNLIHGRAVGRAD